MITTLGAVALGRVADAVGSSVLNCVRVPDPEAIVKGVVIHGPGDPLPDPELLILWAGHDVEPPPCVAIVLRESDLAETLPRLAPDVAVFATSDNVRWSDIYDLVESALSEATATLGGNDVFHLADTLAISLGGAVTIEDADRRVVAFSAVPGQWIDDVRRQGILGRKVPEHVERDEWYGKLWRSPGVVEFRAGAESTARVALAIRVGGHPLGSIWVVGSRNTLSPDAEIILAAATPATATYLTHQDQTVARGRETRAQVFGHLLSGTGVNQSMGCSLPGPAVLIAASREGQTDDPELLDARLADVLSMRAHRFQGTGLAAAIDEVVYALLPMIERSRFDAQLRSTLSRAGFTEGDVAVSDVIADVQQIPRGRGHVDRLLRLHAGTAREGVRVLHVDDELPRLWLAEVGEAIVGVEALSSGIVVRMAQHDKAHGTEYVSTLRAWFEACGDIAAAASMVHVHHNTFRYRLARAGSIFGLQLDDPDQRLLLHLQLRLGLIS